MMEEEYSERGQCFYCGAVLTESAIIERDHFPVPRGLGGTHTVLCCEICHSMKDRIPFAKWPEPWTVQILRDFPRMGRETRIFLAKAIRFMYETPQMWGLQADALRQCCAVEAELEQRSYLYPKPPESEQGGEKSKDERPGGIPYGQRLTADGKHLEPDTGEQAIIWAARELRATGLSLRAVGRALAARGMPPRSGGSWHSQTVKALLAGIA